MNDSKAAHTAEPWFNRSTGADISTDRGVPQTMREMFLDRCRQYRLKPAFVELGGDLDITGGLTYGELEQSVLALACVLAACLPAGSKILLALDGGIGSVELFWAAMLADLVPIPAPAGSGLFHEAAFQRLKTIELHAGASLVVAEGRDVARLGKSLPANWTSLDALKAKAARSGHLKLRAPTCDLAYLQYTSGSMSDPRGVEISQANAIAQCAGLKAAFDVHQPDAGILSWLPWFHDFGLVQGILLPIYGGLTSYLMPTGAFIRRPLRWLEAISRFNIVYSGAPNTAYLACTRVLARHPHWTADLKSWSVAICGAEPVRADTLRSFSETFRPHGFRQQSFFPAYGLAECVLGVTAKQSGTEPLIVDVDDEALERNLVCSPNTRTRTARTLIGCGTPLNCCEVKIVDPKTATELPASTVGEIWVRGPSVSRAYHLAGEATRQTFGAQLTANVDKATYLRTGDLGAFHDGQLLVTGRLKDLIVINGRNLYPHDLEITVQKAHGEVRQGGVIAFSIDRPEGEAVVILAESTGAISEEDSRHFIEAIVTRIGAEHSIDVYDVVVLRRGTLQATSSGKPRRAAARQRYLKGEFQGLQISTRHREMGQGPRNATELIVADAWREVLGIADADISANFFLAGGNSLHATQLVSRIKLASGVELPIRAVFEAPTIAGLTERLRAALAGGEADASPTQQPTPMSRVDASPLSFSQERLWFVSQHVPDSTALNMPLALRIRGKFKVAALQAALASVVERHDILRTTFHATPTGAEARVQPHLPLNIETSKLASADANSESFRQLLERQMALYTHQRFDLDHGPLIRANIIEIAPDDIVLLIVMHHIVGDQWSFAVLIRELSHFYCEALGRSAAPLPPLRLQYADYAIWQRDTFDRERRTAEESYWMELLGGGGAASLPRDFPRLNRPLYRGSLHCVPFHPDLVTQLSALGARHSASLSMVLMTALNVLLQRYTGRDDISIGVSVAGRHRPWSEGLIGTFVNVLVLRTDIDRSLDFATLLARMRGCALDAFANQEMPFDQLVRKLNNQRDASRTPLFQVLFNMVNVPVGQLDFGEAQIKLINFDRGATQFDLTVTADGEHDFSISFEYAVQTFQRETVQRFATHYMRLLEAIAASEHCAVGQLSLVGREETARIVALGRGADLPLPAETAVAWMRPAFASWSNKAALIFEDNVLSYRELDAASSAVARDLRLRGIGRGHRVGIHMTRSARSIVAQVGVLKSGAAYVPLDPVNPPKRLEYIANDADLSLILVDAAKDPTAIWMGNIRTLGIAEIMSASPIGETAAEDASEFEARADDPAYVLYTSGSTGEPKGVVVSHRSLVNLLSSVAAEPGLSSSDCVLAITTLSFDISVVETLLPLGLGASVVVAGADAGDGAALIQLIERYQVSFIQATPSTWHLLISAGWTGSASLKKILVGGETLSQNLAVDLVTRCDEVWNMYGPTESTVWSTAWRVASPRSREISIGRPISNTQVYVLDSDLRVCPIGVEGDLYIGGVGVSLGYVNLPQLTAERFLSDPFAPGNASARLYRTGDRARWLSDGTLVHLGRSDTQVKLRGYRIELAEIEAGLGRNPDVERAVVLVRDVGPADSRLVAYIVPRGEAPSADAIRQYLSRFVPDYMLPQHFVVIDSMPLLPNGKVDTRKLADITTFEMVPSRRITAPRTPRERSIWDIWSDVLGVENFSVDDNFFELGGHSMLALSVVDRVRNEVDQACSIPLLFQHPTIATLVAAMSADPKPDGPLVVALHEVGETPPLFCICGIHLYQDLANHLAPHRQVYALFVPSEAAILEGGPGRRSLSVESMAADYVREIEQRQPRGPYHLAGLSFGGLLAFEVAQQLRRRGAEVALLAMFDTVMPIGRLRLAARNVVDHIRRMPNEGTSWFVDRAQLLIWQALAPLRHRRGPRPAHAADWAIADEVSQAELRGDVYYRAARRYKAVPYDGSAILMLAEDSGMPNTTKLWARLISKLEVVSVRGDHLGILKPPHVATVAEHILSRLDSLRSPTRPSIG